MKALLVQPPFVQLNSPYPAIYYLEAFLRSRGVEARTADHSIELYRSVFSRRGLVPAFEAARRALGEAPDPATRAQLERYLSYEGLYLEWIDGLVAFLSGADPALAHRLAQAVELPMGMRAQAFLEAREGRIAAHEARGLATALLGDLGDLVAYALDPSFGTVRYGERIASSASRFSDIVAALEASTLLTTAYRDLLAAEWERSGAGASRGAPDLLLVTVPFPGCLLGALACAASAREAFGPRLRILLGGGYVTTELRDLKDPGIFDFCDYLCFDSGYGAMDSILEVEGGAPREALYRTMYRDADGRVIAAGFGEAERFARAEDQALAGVFPDYAGVDFGRYLQVSDSDNPMHSLWSDSPWLKYGLARGCYWRRCAFCDTELEYVSHYRPVDVPALALAADAASSRTGLYGLHFTDEAMPMPTLLAFARENRARASSGRRPFHFWGNVRFDSSWTADRCEYLAASGLVAVSGGIEIATEAGLDMTDKGFDLAGLIETLVAMRRAGLLVHAYLIYGFPGQSRQDIVDSAEVCRQLFASGLVDSAFWHRFVLTRHSRMYREWLDGRRPGLEPVDRPWDFANNDLGFAGSEAYDEFDGPLAAALEAWMAGEGLDQASGKADAGLVEGLLARAEARLEAALPRPDGRAHWIAGLPLARPGAGGLDRLTWACRGEPRELALPRAAAEGAALALAALAGDPAGQPYAMIAERLCAALGLGPAELAELRSAGLVVV